MFFDIKKKLKASNDTKESILKDLSNLNLSIICSYEQQNPNKTKVKSDSLPLKSDKGKNVGCLYIYRWKVHYSDATNHPNEISESRNQYDPYLKNEWLYGKKSTKKEYRVVYHILI